MNLSPDRIKDILEELGYKLIDRGRYWHSHAAFRNGDNSTSLQIWKDSGVWRDFVEGTPPLPFKKLLQTHLGTNDKSVIDPYLQSDFERDSTPHVAEEKVTMEKVYDDSILEDLFPHYVFYTKKGISPEVLKALKGGLATKGQMYQRFVFPIYNELNQIHGFSGRDMSNRANAPKWKHIGRKSKWLYPYYVSHNGTFPTQEGIEEACSVIVVESIGDLLNLHEHGFYNVLVSFGLDISPRLLCHLLSLDISKVIISFNNDSNKSHNRGARAAVKNYLKLFSHFDFGQVDVCLPVKNDFGEMNKDDFDKWSVKLDKPPSSTLNSIISFADKLAASKELSLPLLKNLKLLKSHGP